ncbi:MAG: glycosyltransferase [Clostridiaceae bacterium]|nr:glycosyltransferase [Clostridiaceae bacterium]
MKVVFTVATYWPKTDGVQMVTQYQAEGLAKKGHEVVVITSKMNDVPDSETHNGVNIIRVNAYNFYYWHRGDKKEYVSEVKKQCSNADALVAVCLQSFAADWLLDDMDDIKCKKVLYLHGMPDFKMHLSERNGLKDVMKTAFRNTRWKFFYTRQFGKIKKFDAVMHLFENDNSYRYFKNHGYDHNYVIENACEDEFFAEIPENTNNAKNNYFIYVGNYCDRKNQEMAIRAFYETEDTAFGLLLIGSQDNSYYHHLINVKEELDSKYGQRDVQIKFSVPREQIAAYTKNAFACVMSSNYEYYPITIVEALAVGLPFISTDVGVVRQLPGGVIVKNQADMTYWMNFMMRNQEYACGLGKIGKRYAETHLMVINKVNELEKIIQSA